MSRTAADIPVAENVGFADYLALTKPRLSILSVITAMVGYLVVDGPWEWEHFLATMAGISACAGGVAALNQWMERDTDARMKRTADRPIPSGKVPDGAAFVLGWGLCLGGLALLFARASALAAAFALATIVAYLVWYTPAKRTSRWSTEIGAIAGAFPPLIGFAAAHGGMEPWAWLLFALLFFWQIPHFMAIAWIYREDYRDVGFPLLSVRDKSGSAVARWSWVNTIALILVSAAPALMGEATGIYLVMTILLGLWLLWRAHQFLHAVTRDRHARQLFFATIIWLPGQLTSLVVDRLFLL